MQNCGKLIQNAAKCFQVYVESERIIAELRLLLVFSQKFAAGDVLEYAYYLTVPLIIVIMTDVVNIILHVLQKITFVIFLILHYYDYYMYNV